MRLSRCPERDAKVGNEKRIFVPARLFVWLSQERGGMDGRDNPRRDFGCEQFPALACDPKRRAKKRPRGGCAEANEDARPNDSQLRLQPGAAGSDVA